MKAGRRTSFKLDSLNALKDRGSNCDRICDQATLDVAGNFDSGGQQDQNTDVFIPNTDDVRHLMSELWGASRCTAKRLNERFVIKHQLELISFCV